MKISKIDSETYHVDDTEIYIYKGPFGAWDVHKDGKPVLKDLSLSEAKKEAAKLIGNSLIKSSNDDYVLQTIADDVEAYLTSDNTGEMLDRFISSDEDTQRATVRSAIADIWDFDENNPDFDDFCPSDILEKVLRMTQNNIKIHHIKSNRRNDMKRPIKSNNDRQMLQDAVYDGLMEASPYTQDIAVEWFDGEVDTGDFDSVDDLANYIRNRAEDFADANPGIAQDLEDCGLIYSSRRPIKSSYHSWEDFYQKGCKLGLKDYMDKLDIIHDKYGKFDRVPKDKLSTLVNDIPTDTEERNNFVDDMFDYFGFDSILSSKQIKSSTDASKLFEDKEIKDLIYEWAMYGEDEQVAKILNDLDFDNPDTETMIKFFETIKKFSDDTEVPIIEKALKILSDSKQIKSSVRDDFKRGLQNIMREKHAEFADGTLEDNMIDIYDNYVQNYYEDELEEEGGEAVAEDWFRNTYYDDEDGIFIHNSRSIKSGWNSGGFEDKISDFINRFRDAGYITPLDAKGFIEDLNRGRVEEMDLAWIMDAVDADLNDSSQEKFFDKIRDIIKVYSLEGAVANSSYKHKSIQSRVYVGEDGKQYYDPSDENQRYSDCFRWVLDQFHSYDNTTPKEIADAAVEYEKRTGYYTDREDLVAAVMNELYALYGSEEDNYSDEDEEKYRYDDDELRELPPDADDDDYDYGDWESGRPFYSGIKRNTNTLKKLFS